MVEVFAVSLWENEVYEARKEELMLYMPKSGREKVNRYTYSDDAQRTLWGELMIRHVLTSKHKIANTEIQFHRNGNGKPATTLENIVQFNISHSGQWVACAISEKPVGVDVERIKPVSLRLAKRFFSKDEYETLIRLPEERQEEYFFDLWTLKESYVKALGTGISKGLQNFTIHSIDGKFVVKANEKWEELYFRQYQLAADYKLAVCSEENEFSQRIKIFNKEDIIENLSKMEE